MAVTGTETVVLVLCTSGAPSASASAGLTRIRSATDCGVSLDVVSGLGTAAVAVIAVSGSSGGLLPTLGIGIAVGSRSLRTFNGILRVPGVGFHGFQTMAFKRVVSHRRLSTLRFQCTASKSCHSVFRSNAHLFFLSRPSQTPSSHADSNLLTTRLGFGKTCVESSRMLWLLSFVVCGMACVAMVRVVVTTRAEDCRL